MAVAEPFQHGEVRRFLRKLVERGRAVDDRHARSPRSRAPQGDNRGWRGDRVGRPRPRLGVRMREGVAGGLTFGGPDDRTAMTEIVDDALAGRARSLTFALPTLARGVAAPALRAGAAHEDDAGRCGRGGGRDDPRHTESGATPHLRAQDRFVAREPVRAARHRAANEHDASRLPERRARRGSGPCDPDRPGRVGTVAAARRIPGIPATGSGFVQTDQYGRVEGNERVRRGRHDHVPAQARRDRGPTGRRGRRVDRSTRRAPGHAALPSSRFCAAAPHRPTPAVPAGEPAG